MQVSRVSAAKMQTGPCCGSEMKREEVAEKTTLTCPSCGLSDVRTKA